MRESSPSDPLLPFLDELDEDGVTDPELDPRVRAVLLVMHDRLTEAPDDPIRDHHLARIRRTRRRVRRTRALGHVGRLSAVAAVLLLVLAVAGLLPATLQQTVADAATVVGVTLPAPPSTTPASEEVPAHVGEHDEGDGDDTAPADDGDDGDDAGSADEVSSTGVRQQGARSDSGPTADGYTQQDASPLPAELPEQASDRAREATKMAATASRGPEHAAAPARAGERPGQSGVGAGGASAAGSTSSPSSSDANGGGTPPASTGPSSSAETRGSAAAPERGPGNGQAKGNSAPGHS